MIYKTFITLLFLILCTVACSSVFEPEQEIEVLDFRNKKIISKHFKRGKYLYESIGSCGFCHVKSSPKVGNKSIDNIVSYFRSNDTHYGLKWASDFDLRSISTFLALKSSSSKVKDENVEDKSSYFSNKILGYVNHPKDSATASYGRYLTLNLAPCASCHSTDPNYHDNALDKLRAKNLKWNKEKYISFLNTGQSLNKFIKDKDCAWSFLRNAELSDKQAVAYFLESLR